MTDVLKMNDNRKAAERLKGLRSAGGTRLSRHASSRQRSYSWRARHGVALTHRDEPHVGLLVGLLTSQRCRGRMRRAHGVDDSVEDLDGRVVFATTTTDVRRGDELRRPETPAERGPASERGPEAVLARLKLGRPGSIGRLGDRLIVWADRDFDDFVELVLVGELGNPVPFPFFGNAIDFRDRRKNPQWLNASKVIVRSGSSWSALAMRLPVNCL